jgi:hypothetical protein
MARFGLMTTGICTRIGAHPTDPGPRNRNRQFLCGFVIATIPHNVVPIYRTLRVTPAMAAGIADHVWSIEEIEGLL